MAKEPRLDVSNSKINPVLQRLSEALDISPSEFLDQSSSDLGRSLELLALWVEIKDPQDQAKALSFLRSLIHPEQKSLNTTIEMSGEPIALAHAMQKPDLDP